LGSLSLIEANPGELVLRLINVVQGGCLGDLANVDFSLRLPDLDLATMGLFPSGCKGLLVSVADDSNRMDNVVCSIEEIETIVRHDRSSLFYNYGIATH
jgi:hypothetical protein